MSHTHIALMGRAGSGKDAVARRLAYRAAYTRVAFADPLKDMALALDPIVGAAEAEGRGFLPQRLSTVVAARGWEGAKAFAEVRRTLQRLGQSVRDQDADYWLNLALAKVDTADRWNLPVAITDCRYPNEADALRARGFRMVKILRPTPGGALTAAGLEIRQHVSETALDGYPADVTIANVGTLADLNSRVDELI